MSNNQLTERKTEQEGKDFEEMERYDESQIVDEVRGHLTLPKFFYELKNGSVGISWVGIKALASYMSKNGQPISITNAEREETEDSYRYTVTARLLSTGEERIGISEQPKLMKLSSGAEIKDPFVLQKALSKAQRNALRIFIPESAIEEAYQRWRSGGTVEPKNLKPSNPEPSIKTTGFCECGHSYWVHLGSGQEYYCPECIRAGKDMHCKQLL